MNLHRERRWTKTLATAMLSLGAVSLGITSLKPVTAEAAVQKKPNVVLIALDDIGFSDLGIYGSEISTPNIDSLARAGIRYTRFDTKAICSPTRASVLTGRNCQTIGMEDLASTKRKRDPQDTSPRRGEISQNVEFLPQALRNDGYATFAIGKWHLSPEYETGKPGDNTSLPLQRGFDYYYGYRMGWTDQYHPHLMEGNDTIPDPYHHGYYLSSDLADHAIHVMTESQKKHPEKPMFLYLAMPFAHAPHQAPKEYIDRYAKIYARGWDAIREERFEREKKLGIMPADMQMHPREKGDQSWNSLTDQQKRVYARFMAAYAAYIEYGDEQLGRVLKYIHTSGLDKNTMIILFTDNGAAGEGAMGGFRTPYHDTTPLAEIDAHLDELGGPNTQPLYQRPWALAGDTPYRRYKVWPYLGGVRTPMMIKWQGHISDPGAIRNQWVEVTDIAPTILEAAGGHFDDTVNGVPQIPVSGVSFFKTIGSRQASSLRTVQFFQLRGNRAIETTDWRAVAFHKNGTRFADDQWELFDLRTDPGEAHDLAKTNPDKVQELKTLWNDEARKYGDLPLKESGPRSAAEFADAFNDD